jgi:hypothetical protein
MPPQPIASFLKRHCDPRLDPAMDRGIAHVLFFVNQLLGKSISEIQNERLPFYRRPPSLFQLRLRTSAVMAWLDLVKPGHLRSGAPTDPLEISSLQGLFAFARMSALGGRALDGWVTARP